MSKEKKKYLFYYEGSIEAFTPVLDLTVEDIIALSFMSDQEETVLKLKCIEMTEEEFNNL